MRGMEFAFQSAMNIAPVSAALAAPPQVPVAAPANGTFDQALASATSRQQVPLLGTICRTLAAENPFAIAAAAARGFLVGGPAGAAIGAGLTALGPVLHPSTSPAGDRVTGDSCVVERTEALLTAYHPSSQT